MALFPMNIGSNGGTSGDFEEIGAFSLAGNTTAQTKTLSESLANYTYVAFSFTQCTSNGYAGGSSYYSFLAMVKVDYFKSNALTCGYTSGDESKAHYRNCTISYSNDTNIVFQFLSIGYADRQLYVYGLK